MLRLKLADDLIIAILPILLGEGTPFVQHVGGDLPLHLKNVTPYKTGMVEIWYEIKSDRALVDGRGWPEKKRLPRRNSKRCSGFGVVFETFLLVEEADDGGCTGARWAQRRSRGLARGVCRVRGVWRV